VVVYYLSGGAAAWGDAGQAYCPIAILRPATVTAPVQGAGFRASSFFLQSVAVFGGFTVKPLYTLLAILIAWVLWRQTAPDLRALKWAMVSFALGENFCAVTSSAP
jgi:ABC-type glucose/galactose transport system permease subunit